MFNHRDPPPPSHPLLEVRTTGDQTKTTDFCLNLFGNIWDSESAQLNNLHPKNILSLKQIHQASSLRQGVGEHDKRVPALLACPPQRANVLMDAVAQNNEGIRP